MRLLVPLSKSSPEEEADIWAGLAESGEPLERLGAKLALGGVLADRLNRPLEAEAVFGDVLLGEPFHKEAIDRLERLYGAREGFEALKVLYGERAQIAEHPAEKRAWLEKSIEAVGNGGGDAEEGGAPRKSARMNYNNESREKVKELLEAIGMEVDDDDDQVTLAERCRELDELCA